MTPELWALPRTARLGGDDYAIHSDFRDVLTVIAWLTGAEGADLDEAGRWYVALCLFYPDFAALPPALHGEAMRFLADFIAAGRAGPETAARPGARLLDWQQDAPLIAAGVNKAAGCDVRGLPYLHWWSFLAFFDAIGEGPLSAVVSIRDKLRRGKKLEKWEQDYYRANRARIDLRPRPAAPADEEADRAERARLLALLDG